MDEKVFVTPVSNFIIRKAEINDIDNGLLEVFVEGYRFHQKGRSDIFIDISDEILKNDLIKNFEELTTIVILENNIIIGYLSYKIKQRHTKKLDVDQLVISEKYRGKGLGKKLMNEVQNIAIENNCDRIELNCWLFNENAIKMYEQIGFDKQRIVFEKML